jgi:hypothetical protein
LFLVGGETERERERERERGLRRSNDARLQKIVRSGACMQKNGTLHWNWCSPPLARFFNLTKPHGFIRFHIVQIYLYSSIPLLKMGPFWRAEEDHVYPNTIHS